MTTTRLSRTPGRASRSTPLDLDCDRTWMFRVLALSPDAKFMVAVVDDERTFVASTETGEVLLTYPYQPEGFPERPALVSFH